MKLLQQLCEIPGPSGSEFPVREFLEQYVRANSPRWKCIPEIITGSDLQDCLLLIFGKPRTVVFAHMDTVGFTVRYFDQLIPIGSPEAEAGTSLVGLDSRGPIICTLDYDEKDRARYRFGRSIERGTTLTYQVDFKETKKSIQSAYLDDRAGIYNALRLAETLENGILAFSCWEEHGGGSVAYLAGMIYERWQVRQALISDMTWVTDGVKGGDGVAISVRDRNIPRRSYVDQIIRIAQASNIPFQLEVEGAGASDGRELQLSPYPFDWCFVGAPQLDPHTPNEQIEKADLEGMCALYRVLMEKL